MISIFFPSPPLAIPSLLDPLDLSASYLQDTFISTFCYPLAVLLSISFLSGIICPLDKPNHLLFFFPPTAHALFFYPRNLGVAFFFLLYAYYVYAPIPFFFAVISLLLPILLFFLPCIYLFLFFLQLRRYAYRT